MPDKDEKIITFILSCKKEAEDATGDRRRAGRELWKLYQNKQKDYSTKRDWQSKVFVPKIHMAINQSSSLVKRAVLSTRKLFKLVPKRKDDEEADKVKDELSRTLKRYLDNSNFADVYGEMIKGAFLLGLGAPKVLWNSGLSFANVDVLDLYTDPTFEPSSGRSPRYIVEEGEMDLAVFKDMVRKINKNAGRQVYKSKIIKDIEEDFEESDAKVLREERRGINPSTKVNKMVKLTEFWGNLIIDDKLESNQLVILANDKYVIRKQTFPFDDNEPPHVLTVPLIYPHRGSWGESLVEPVVSLQYAYNSISNLVIDNLNWTVNKLFEVNVGNVLNAKSLTSVFPGKIIYKHTPNRVMEEVRTTGIGTDVYNMLIFLNAEIEKGTAVTEFIMGSSGKSKTAKEAELKTAQAQGMFDVIARDIEANSLAPVIKKSFNRLIQFGVIDPKWNDRFEFIVGGLSLLLARREQQGQIAETLSAALKSPELKEMTDLPELWKKYLDTNNLGEVFSEKPQPPTLDQRQQLNELAAQKAKQVVGQMSPSQISQFQEAG